MGKNVTIKYCAPCQYEKQALDLAEELKIQFGERLTEVVLEPTQSVGNFEVSMDGELVYSKKKTGRLPHPGEVEQLMMTRIFN
ncbi:MAG: Rdx family protein [Pelolinea sp.]|nr:Rdx family protein [Pelolinea sp.]